MKRHLKHLYNKGIIILALLLIPTGNLLAQTGLIYQSGEQPSMDMFIDAREVFEYEVTYGFLTLGWVDVELLPDTTVSGEKAFHLRTRIRSNSRVPFVGTRIVNYESIFQYNDDWPFSHIFWRDDIHDDDFDRVRVIFDRDEGLVHFYEYGEFEQSMELEEPASGGDIIFYYSRMFAGIEDEYVLPVYTENEKGYVRAASGPDQEFRRYDAFDDPVPTYMSEGTADIEGPFGFRGRFRSWFSTDDMRVPVEAHVRVIFGNVKVRLVSYERHGTN